MNSVLHDRHTALHAAFTDVTGWQVPQQYGDVRTEYQAVRSAVGLADLSHRGFLRVTGDDRIKWLQSILSNDLLPLKPGQGLYTSMLTHKGKMLTYVRLYVTPDAVLIEDVGEIGDTTAKTLKKFLLYGTKAKMETLTGAWGLLLLSGPKALEVVRTALGVDLSSAAVPSLTTATFQEHPVLALRVEETGEQDVILATPNASVVALWDQLRTVGGPAGLCPIGTHAREMLRIEAGLPKAGADLNEEIVPPEANLEGKAFSLNKGCYPGQEVVARMDTYGNVRRHLVGLVLKDAPVPTTGAKLFSGDREVGWISSAIDSLQLGKPIALAYPLRDFSTPATELTVEVDGRRLPATVHTLPFFRRA
ncbi:MAG: aminomethyltransferase family protein [Nitrospiraceae bacterium]